jgi:hypothetical protein
MLRSLILSVFISCAAFAQNPWEADTYPDEAGFKMRMEPMLHRIADQGFGIRSLAISKCPDTGLPVKTWAVEGETIISPYSGRAFLQGPTGYFGPKARNEKGEIIAFGGDPLKYDLSPAATTLMLNPGDAKAQAFLSIPGNMRQQYHFACSNWARAYPLIGDQFSQQWKSEFFHWISVYEENRRPSDGEREFSHISHPHNLVGQEGELLGGNPFDGGTENHKTMWRTSALLYSQLMPDSATISGYPVQDAERITKEMLRDYLKKLLYVGNGEYDSEVYYPYTIKSFMNLYDFSPDPETKELAKFALDFFFATYGVKVVDGAIAGAQKRGYLADPEPDMMDVMQWAFFNNTSRNMGDVITTMHQATTTYRPNEIIWNITRKNVDVPFEASMSRPFYHMDYPHAFAETFYCSRNFAMGNMQMTIVDNPNQQMVWSVVANGTDGPLCFSGGHPLRGSTSGHSPYTQTLHSKGALILFTAPTKPVRADTASIAQTYKNTPRNNLWIMPKSEQPENFEISHRQKYGVDALHGVHPPEEMTAAEIVRFWKESIGSASSWFYFPRKVNPVLKNDNYFLETESVFIAVLPLSKSSFVVNPSDEIVAQLPANGGKGFFSGYGLIAFPGQQSGYVVEVVEKKDFKSMEDFAIQLKRKARLKVSNAEPFIINFHSMYGDKFEMQYQAGGLRCKGIINGEVQDWDRHTDGATYSSPYVTVKEGMMQVSDGRQSYVVDFTGEHPVWLPE